MPRKRIAPWGDAKPIRIELPTIDWDSLEAVVERTITDRQRRYLQDALNNYAQWRALQLSLATPDRLEAALNELQGVARILQNFLDKSSPEYTAAAMMIGNKEIPFDWNSMRNLNSDFSSRLSTAKKEFETQKALDDFQHNPLNDVFNVFILQQKWFFEDHLKIAPKAHKNSNRPQTIFVRWCHQLVGMLPKELREHYSSEITFQTEIAAILKSDRIGSSNTASKNIVGVQEAVLNDKSPTLEARIFDPLTGRTFSVAPASGGSRMKDKK